MKKGTIGGSRMIEISMFYISKLIIFIRISKYPLNIHSNNNQYHIIVRIKDVLRNLTLSNQK